MEFTGEVIKITEETPDVKTFRISKPSDFTFIPGQYCLVSFLEEFPGEERPFTFTTSPTVKDYFELTIKEMHEFTLALHSAKPGLVLKIDGPKGETLNFNETVKEDAVFIAGGSGITPFMSAIRYAIAKKLPNNITLLFGNRTEKDIIYRKELDEINEKHDNIIVVHVLSQEPDWKEEKGRINKDIIDKYVKYQKNKLWYVVGPPGMNKAMNELLLDIGIPEDNIKIEKWELPGKHD